MNLAPDVDAQIRNMRPTYREPIPRDSLDTKTMRRLEMERFVNCPAAFTKLAQLRRSDGLWAKGFFER